MFFYLKPKGKRKIDRFFIIRHFDDSPTFSDFKRRIKAHLTSPAIFSFRKSVPMIAGDSNHVPDLQFNFAGASHGAIGAPDGASGAATIWRRSMSKSGDLLVSILAAEIINIVQRMKTIRSVHMHRLHQFVRNPTNLKIKSNHIISYHIKNITFHSSKSALVVTFNWILKVFSEQSRGRRRRRGGRGKEIVGRRGRKRALSLKSIDIWSSDQWYC